MRSAKVVVTMPCPWQMFILRREGAGGRSGFCLSANGSAVPGLSVMMTLIYGA